VRKTNYRGADTPSDSDDELKTKKKTRQKANKH